MAVTINGTTGIANDGGYTGDGVVFADTTPANTLVTTTGGNVGIGTSSPTVYGSYKTLEVRGTGGGLLQIGTGASTAAYLFQDGTNAGFNNIANGIITFGTNNTERARITSGGDLLVGTTNSLGGERGTFTRSSSGISFVVQNDSGSGAQTYRSKMASGANNTSSYHFVGTSGDLGVDKVYIYGNGNIVNVNNSYGSLSDLKLKENIVDATPKLAQLNQVRIVNYNLIGETQKQLGVVAQELEQIFPGMVEESPDQDSEGNDLGTTTKSVKYSVFVPMLIKGLQELKAINDAQAQTITALTARVTALEGA